MKKIGKSVIALFIGLCLSPVGVQGLEEEQGEDIRALISFNLSVEDRFVYEVGVNGGGSLYDGSQRIREGVMEYQLSVGQRKRFRLEADKGYEVKEIRINDKKIEANTEEIEIAGVSATSKLIVQFGKIEESVVPKPDIPTPPDNTVQPDEDYGEIGGSNDIGNQKKGTDLQVPTTGDILRISEYICLLLLIAYIALRGINTQSRDDNIAISLMDIKENGCKETLKEEKKDE